MIKNKSSKNADQPSNIDFSVNVLAYNQIIHLVKYDTPI